MWIMTRHGFFTLHVAKKPDEVIVTSRLKADLKNQFGPAIIAYGEKIYRVACRDFAYRTYLPRKVVADVISQAVADISYDHLKDQVTGMELKELCQDIWYAGLKAQTDEQGRMSNDVKLWVDREGVSNDKLP